MKLINDTCTATDCPLHPKNSKECTNEEIFWISDNETDVAVPLLCLMCKHLTEKPDIRKILKHSRLKKKLRNNGYNGNIVYQS